MEAEPAVRCDLPGGAHALIYPWAKAELVVYCLGIPCMFATILFIHLKAIRADQELRARGEGDIPANNPNIRVRHKFRKLYEDFKPSLSFWKLVLIARKFGIAVTAIMLTGNPMLQVSHLMSNIMTRGDESSNGLATVSRGNTMRNTDLRCRKRGALTT